MTTLRVLVYSIQVVLVNYLEAIRKLVAKARNSFQSEFTRSPLRLRCGGGRGERLTQFVRGHVRTKAPTSCTSNA